MCGVLCGQVAGLGSIQFRNWNCCSIPIQFWNWNWNWWIENGIWIEDSEIRIENPELNFLELLPQHLLVNQQFPNFSFNRGHNLPCDWLLMQQGLSSWNITPMLTRSAPLRKEVALTCTTCLSTKSSKTNPPAVSPLGLIDIPRFM